MLRHCGTVAIRTNRLLLRAFRVADVEAMFYGWMSDAEVARFTSWNAHASMDDTRAYVDFVLSQDGINAYNWVIELEGRPVGTINVCYSDDSAEVCGIAYALSRAFWGKGIISEAVRAVVRFLFDEVGYRKIIAGCDGENVGSRRVMEKIGMKQEACFRQHIRRKDGSFGDDLQFGLFRNEFVDQQ